MEPFARAAQLRKHLHGRGEDIRIAAVSVRYLETPPRTWRRPRWADIDRERARNTSTDVEKTNDDSTAGFEVEKHLHGRGEDL